MPTPRIATLITCDVCGGKSRNAYYAANACRACAEFFARMLKSGKPWACRKGTNDCVTAKRTKYLCKRCRFDKCIRIGMPTGKKLNAAPDAPSTSRDTEDTVPSICAAPRLSLDKCPLLAKLVDEYKMCCERRRAIECALRSTDRHQNVRISQLDYLKKELYYMTLSFLVEYSQHEVVELRRFASQCFHQFNTFTEKEKSLFTRCFTGLFSAVEVFESTLRELPDSINHTIFMGSFKSCYTRNSDEFFRGVETTSMKDEAHRSYQMYGDEYRRGSMVYRRVQLSHVEYLALQAILMWTLDNVQWMPDTVLKVADAVKASIFSELHWYYSEVMKISDYAGRLGELMALVHTLMETKAIMREEVELRKVLNMYRENDLICDMVP